MPKLPYQGREVDAIQVGFKVVREDWNEYQLSDGSEVRMRLLVSEMFLFPGEYDQEGNPVYLVKSTNMMVVRSPDNLKKSQST